MTDILTIIQRAFLDRGLEGVAVDQTLQIAWACDAVKETFNVRPELRLKTTGGYFATTLAETETDIPATLEEFASAIQDYILFRYRTQTRERDEAAAEYASFLRKLGVRTPANG